MRVWFGLIGALLAVAPAHAAPAQEGTWSVQVTCAPGAQGGKQYVQRFLAVLKGGMLHGETGMAGQPGSSVLEGPVAPDGSATLQVRGLIGMDAYATGRIASGTPYSYPVSAQFDGTRGEGKRMSGRACAYAFLLAPG